MREKRFLTWLALGALVVAATVGSAVLTTGAPSVAPLPTAPLPRPLDTTAVPAADAGMTTITLEVTRASPADPTTTESLTATITPSTAAGVVQFDDGSSTLGDPVTLTNGTASTTITLPAGDNSLIADFTPADTTAFSGSISNTVDYPINSAPATQATTTTTTLQVTPASPTDPTATESLTATITPSTATGVVQFNDGNTTLGDPVTLTNGTATTTTTLPAGDHSLTADFTPTNPGDVGPSTSDPVSLTEPPLPLPQRGPNR